MCRDAERNARDILQITSARKADDGPSKALLQQKNLAIEMDRRVNAALLPMEQHIGKPVGI
ncbi:hypothetical protein GGQ73_000106 [Rhizobium skierniewicense]|uniref:Uncharacterized protein n=1 Tax=Rhizobium skierniewicense TaxID=984260 RepID=A0A7W6C1T8_9HYPH|nr:hypothetical protein [Rhizobium skierniewicense]MBB3944183.1 hypothetical protein [Rhizobium skierniewicense]